MTYMRKLFGLAVALALVCMLSGPANAQSLLTPPVVVDRTAVTLTYEPTGAGASTFDIALSYQFGPGPWDILVSSIGPSAGATGFRFGGRYHVRPLSPTLEVYGTVTYFSPSAGNSRFELGGGFTDTVAPGLRLYYVSTYNSQGIAAGSTAYISTNLGVQYEINRQFALVAGLEGNTGLGYIGINFDFAAR
jgi:hypothetical protein